MSDKIHRSENNRIIAGVCGGLGEYFNIDPTIVRLTFVVLTIWGGLGILLYIILFVIMPEPRSQDAPTAKDLSLKRLEARHWVGGGLILFGAILLADTLNNVYDFFPT